VLVAGQHRGVLPVSPRAQFGVSAPAPRVTIIVTRQPPTVQPAEHHGGGECGQQPKEMGHKPDGQQQQNQRHGSSALPLHDTEHGLGRKGRATELKVDRGDHHGEQVA